MTNSFIKHTSLAQWAIGYEAFQLLGSIGSLLQYITVTVTVFHLAHLSELTVTVITLATFWRKWIGTKCEFYRAIYYCTWTIYKKKIEYKNMQYFLVLEGKMLFMCLLFVKVLLRLRKCFFWLYQKLIFDGLEKY